MWQETRGVGVADDLGLHQLILVGAEASMA